MTPGAILLLNWLDTHEFEKDSDYYDFRKFKRELRKEFGMTKIEQYKLVRTNNPAARWWRTNPVPEGTKFFTYQVYEQFIKDTNVDMDPHEFGTNTGYLTHIERDHFDIRQYTSTRAEYTFKKHF